MKRKSQDGSHKPNKRLKVDSRFKFSSTSQQIKSIQLNPANLLNSRRSTDDEGEIPLLQALETALESNPTPAYRNFYSALYPHIKSLPLILHHRQDITNIILNALITNNDSEVFIYLDALLDVLYAYLETLQDYALVKEYMPDIINALIVYLFDANTLPATIQKVLNCLVYIFMAFGKDLPVVATWEIVKKALLVAEHVVNMDISLQDSPNASNVDSEEELEGESEFVTAIEDDDMLQAAATEDATSIASIDDNEDDDQGSDPSIKLKRTLDAHRAKTQVHLRHLLCSTLGFLIRKISKANLTLFFSSIFKDISTTEQDTECLAWIISDSIKSINHTLHSKSYLILKELFGQVEALQNHLPLQVKHSIRYALTSTIHHLKPETSTEFIQTVLGFIRTDPMRYLWILNVMVGTRKGNRIQESTQRKVVWEILEHVETSTEEFEEVFVKVFIGWATIEECLKHGQSLFDRLYSSQDYGKMFQITLALKRLDFSLFDHFCSSKFFSALLDYAAVREGEAISILAKMLFSNAWTHKLASRDIQRLASILQVPLEQSLKVLAAKGQNVSPKEAMEIIETFSLASLLPANVTSTSSIIDDKLSTGILHMICEDTEAKLKKNFAETPFNLVYCGSILLSLVPSKAFDQVSIFDLIERAGWHLSMLKSISDCIKRCKLPITSDQLYTGLKHLVASENEHMRRVAVDILSSTRSSNELQSILKLISEAENINLTFQDARERVQSVKRLAISAKNVTDRRAVDLAMRYLIGNLKINFRPLWSEAVDSLVTLASEHQDLLWTLLKDELRGCVQFPEHIMTIPNTMWPTEDLELGHSTVGDGTFMDKMTVKYSQVLQVPKESILIQSTQKGTDYLQVLTYEKQILSLMSRIPSLTVKQSRDIVPLFLHLQNNEATEVSTETNSKERSQRLISWLDMFSHLHNPKAFYQSDLLLDSLHKLLCNGHIEIQRSALSCVYTWKDPHVMPYREHLLALLDSKTFRDGLLNLPISPNSSVISSEDRPQLLQLLIRLLYGLLSSRSVRTSGKSTAIVSVLSNCTSDELTLFVDLMLSPLNENGAGKHRFMGFLALLEVVLKYLGNNVEHRLDDFMKALMDIMTTHGTDKDIRRLCLKRLVDMFRYTPSHDYNLHIAAAFNLIVKPRVDQSQGDGSNQISLALLDLAILWADADHFQTFLLKFDERFFPSLLKVLNQESSTSQIFGQVLTLLETVLANVSDSDPLQSLLQKFGRDIITAILQALQGRSRQMRLAGTDIKRLLVTFNATFRLGIEPQSMEAYKDFAVSLLNKPHHIVPEANKIEVLAALMLLEPLLPTEQKIQMLEQLIPSFQSFTQRKSRSLLVNVFIEFAKSRPSYHRVAPIIADMNAYSEKRHEEPDFELRSRSFQQILAFDDLTCEEWMPLIYNALYFIQDKEEYSLRSNASLTLKRFLISRAAMEGNYSVFTSTILPAIKRGVKSREESVRVELLTVLSAAISSCPEAATLADLQPLLVEGDEEANFFTNIFHIQHHRRLRAMRRVAQQAGNISNANLVNFILPILSHYLPNPRSKDMMNGDLASQAIETVNEISKQLTWSSYKNLLLYYLKMTRKTESINIKISVKASVAVLRSFHFDMSNSETSEDSRRVHHAVTQSIMPLLFESIEMKAEDTEPQRIALAEGAANIVALLSTQEKKTNQTRLIMNLAHILRSREQSSRDAARKTMCNLVNHWGVSSFGLAFRELASALQRGPQKHVQAFVVHALLVGLKAEEKLLFASDLISEIVALIKYDLFDSPSLDRESTEFLQRTHMREVKSSKSADSFALLAASVDPTQISILLAPLRDILALTETSKVLKIVDDLLSRMANALQQNSRLSVADLLNLCTSLLKQNTRFLLPKKAKVSKKNDHIVTLERQQNAEEGTYSRNAHRFVGLGLDLLSTALKHKRFDLANSATIGTLNSLLPLVGNALYSTHDTLLLKSLRLVTGLIQCNLGTMANTAPLMIKQIINIIQRSGTAQNEVGQTAIKTLITVLREVKSSTVTSEQLSFLLKLISDEIEEGSEAQSVLFGLLRGMMARKFAAPEIYDLMDHIADMLVTSQSSSVRETCRNAYLVFLLDYPQSKGRLQARFTFLTQQLQYVYEDGRLSAMEILHALLTRFPDDLITGPLSESLQTFFLALVLVAANDDASRCRQFALKLLDILLRRITPSARDSHLNMLQQWSVQEDATMKRASIQLLGTLCSLPDLRSEELANWKRLTSVLIQEIAEEFSRDADGVKDHLLVYHSLVSFGKIRSSQSHPELSAESKVWNSIRSLMLFPHFWVQSASSRLLASILPDSVDDAVSSSHPTSFDSLVEIADKHAIHLQEQHLPDTLAAQIVKNLFTLARSLKGCQQLVTFAQEPQEPLVWLAVKLSRQARQSVVKRPSPYAAEKFEWSLQPSSVLKWMAAIIQSFEGQELKPLAQSMVHLFYQIAQDTNKADDQLEPLQRLAIEVQEMLQVKIGQSEFMVVYSQIQRSADDSKASRKEQAALLALNDPEQAAHRKEKRSKAKLESRKRKIKSFADARERFNEEPRKKLRVRQTFAEE